MEKATKIILALLIFGILFLSANLVQAVPLPWGIALNHETKECAGYWAGDEFTHHELPSGWKAYYPDYESYNETTDLITIETDIGTFNLTSFHSGEWHYKFCNETGYTYVSQNIGMGSYLTDLGAQEQMIENIWLIVYIVVIIALITLT